jgi:hypothetical protein
MRFAAELLTGRALTDLIARHSDAPGLPIRLSPAHEKTRLSIAAFAKQFCPPHRH